MASPTLRAVGLSLALATGWINGACAAEFNLFLTCTGTVNVHGQTKPANLDLAMRDNNTTALIQQSNVLPIGERFKYTASPVSYTMLYKMPRPGTVVYQDWVSGQLIIWQPNLKRLATIRMAIDRHSGKLNGEMLDFDDVSLGTLAMECAARDMEDAPEPKF
ncbi:MAG: hypothetical protein KGL57_00255 [Burkholderiales bacterium]|nr:hypothetical protein [Burkholderiales bacterium]